MHRTITNRVVSVLTLAVVIHAIVLFVALPVLSRRLAPSYNQDRFADGYDLLAENLVAGHGYRFYPNTARTLMREPGYPLILAGLMLMFGKSLSAVKLTNMILALLTTLVMIQIMKDLVPETKRSSKILLVGPALLFLFDPGTLIAESRGGVEITFAFLLTLFIWSVYRAIRSNRCRDYVVSGTILGVTALVRSTPILFPLFLLSFVLYCDRRRAGRPVIFRNISALVLATLVVLSPWIIRNYLLTKEFVPTASVLGVSAQAGQYINERLFDGKPWWLLDREASRERDRIARRLGLPFEDGPGGYYQTFYKSTDEITFSRYLMAGVVSEYKRSPTLLLRCLGQNLLNFWIAGKTWGATALNAVLQLPYLVFATLGVIYCFRNRRRRPVSLLVLFITYYVAVHVAILAQARYSISIMPLVSMLCALGIYAVQRRVGEREREPELKVVDV